MNKKNLIILEMFCLIGILSIATISAAYLRSNAAYTSSANFDYGFGYSGQWQADRNMCEAGQDFVIQIAPFGCEPAVVRSDLLEEQNARVFCQLAATKINPLIKVDAIESISFSGKYPKEISGIGFHPAKAALGVNGDLNSPILSNIGYIVIVLKQQPKESEMPDYVSGNLTATIKYDIKNAYGIGKATFYLPEINDAEWESKKNQYSFWKGKGYLKAEGIEANGASISIHDGTLRRISLVSLEKGKTSNKIYLPGFDCLAGLQLRLDGLEAPDTRAKLDVNGEIVEVAESEEFLEGRCRVINIDKSGLVESVEIKCREDKSGIFGGKSFDLSISPKVELEIDGKKDIYEIGDYLYDKEDKRVYLGFVNTFGNTNKEEDLYGYLIAVPASINQKKLTKKEISSLADYDKGWVANKPKSFKEGATDLLKFIRSSGINVYKWTIKGENIKFIKIGEKSSFGEDIEIIGFAGAKDEEFKFSETDISDLEVGNSIKKEEDYKKLPVDSKVKVDDSVEFIKIENNKWKKDTGILFSSSNMSEYENVEITFIAESSNKESSEEIYKIQNYYDSAMADYDTVINSYSGEKLPEDLYESGVTAGEEALYRKIVLAHSLGQRKTAVDLCDEFEEKYPKSKKNLNEYCKEDYKFSSSEISTAEVMINNELRRISFDGIYEPNLDDFNAEIFIEGTGGKRNKITLTKNQIYYLDELRGDNEMVYSSSRSGEFKYTLYISFSSSEGEWKWSMNKKNWFKLSETKIPEVFDKEVSSRKETYITKSDWDLGERIGGTNNKKEPYIPFTINNEDVMLFEKLDKYGKDFSAGKRILEEEEFTSSFGVEYIKLIELDENSAKLVFNLYPKGIWSSIKTVTVSNDKGILEKDTPNSFGSDFIFTLKDINLERQAKVSVIPTIDYAETKTNVSFKIGIEKRAIQLSPKKINEKLKNLNKSIEEWQEKSEKLGKIVKGLKTACLATGLFLSVKNLVTDAGGKSIARTQVMRGKEGWNDRCSKLISEGKYSTMNECFTKNADKIDEDVDKWYEIIQQSDERHKSFREGITDTNWFGEIQVDDEEYKKRLFTDENKNKLKNGLENNYGETVEIDGKKIPVSEIINMINEDTLSISDYRDLEVLAEASGDSSLKKIANSEIKEKLTSIYVHNKDITKVNTVMNDAETQGFKNADFSYSADKDSIEEYWNGWKELGKEINGNDFEDNKKYNLKIQSYGGKEYLFVLDKGSGSTYGIDKAYEFKDFSNNKINIGEEIKDEKILNKFTYTLIDPSSYNNNYKNSISDPKNRVLRYYETEPYAGMPALVPFDLDEGWYASIKQTLPVLGNLQSYDKSGRVTNFYVCNVGENEKEENRGGDDICQGINTATNQPYNQFHGLSSSDASKIIKCAVEAIEQASRQYGNPEVRIHTSCDSFSIKVGKPAVDVPEVQCQDFMSPTECKWLFNVCDPVICPSSRCNLGGTYYVKDVIQSGIIGSIFLCLPNIREEIYIPVCLTGIQAGIDGYISILKSHRKCLEEALNDGKMIGICDEIYSIYVCEFFWRQALPLVEMIIPKMMEWMMGKNIHGGGEYLSVQDAWNNAEKSVDHFTNYYASTSFEAFKSGIVESIGTEICKNSISGTYPDGESLLDSLTEPDSPSQYHGRFDEIPYTTVTSPPMSQYKVSYHIYAGKNSRAYYQVYLKEGTGGSFYHDTSYKRIVDSGYIPKGKEVGKTKNFIAPSGYKQMCIVVNGEEECGFGEVSTSFAVNYIEDKYAQEQASAEDVTTEKECISGSASFYSLLNPNLQSAAEEVLSPEIYNEGIIRICATKNPGTTTDENAGEINSRWVDVGYCDDENMRCWLDMDSVDRVIKNLAIKNETLSALTNHSMEALMSEGNYLTNEEVAQEIEDINSRLVGGYELDAIEHINNIIDKLFWNIHKVRLLLMRGDAYGQLARKAYYEKNVEKIEKTDSGDDDSEKTCEEVCREEGKTVESCWKDKEEEHVLNDCEEYDGIIIGDYCCIYEEEETEKEEDGEETRDRHEFCEVECMDNPSYSGGYFVGDSSSCKTFEDLLKVGDDYYCCCIKEKCTPALDPSFSGICGDRKCGEASNGTCGPVSCGTCDKGYSCDNGACVISEEGECTDCDTWISSCDYKKCHSYGDSCYYRGDLFLRKNCINLDDACKEINNCDGYSKEECENNPCGLNSDSSEINCRLEEDKCITEEIKIKNYIFESDRSRTEVTSKVRNINDNCLDYVGLVYNTDGTFKYSEYIPDPLLLIALIDYESKGCNPNAVSKDDCVGLMQIQEATFNDICKNRINGITSFEDIKGEINVLNNIKCGLKIFKTKYNWFKHSCSSDENCESEFGVDKRCIDGACVYRYKEECEGEIKDEYYSNWETALRAYNGWSCSEKGDLDYVEDVLDKWRRYVGA